MQAAGAAVAHFVCADHRLNPQMMDVRLAGAAVLCGGKGISPSATSEDEAAKTEKHQQGASAKPKLISRITQNVARTTSRTATISVSPFPDFVLGHQPISQ
jgi:hypothetical protein